MAVIYANRVELKEIEVGVGGSDTIEAIGRDNPYLAEVLIKGNSKIAELSIAGIVPLDQLIEALQQERERMIDFQKREEDAENAV